MGGNSSCGKPESGEPAGAAPGAIVVGCIDYTDQIRTIWAGMKDHFQKNGVDFDFVLFTSYERQVEALLSGFIDIAWNGPLAHVRTQKRTKNTSLSLGMRDVDCGFVTHIIVRKKAGIQGLSDLEKKRIAAGTRDSPQACLLPLQFLKSQGVHLETLEVTFFDRDLGKHGDTALGEVEVMKELSQGNFDAGFVSDLMWQRALSAGDVNPEELEIMDAGKVPPFNHCQFDALGTLDAKKRQDFESTIFSMDFSNKDHACIMKLEGIRAKWEKPQEEGYETMRAALASEPNMPFPSPLYVVEEHPFEKMVVA